MVGCATAILSIGAGVIHVSAAADHTNLPVMMAGFLIIATVQAALGGLLLWRRPTPLILTGALALMLGAVGVWVVSRTAGLPFLPGGHMEPIGFKDGITVLFELAAVPGLLTLMSPEIEAVRLPSPRLGTRTVAGIGTGVFLLMVPAMVLAGGGHHSAGQMQAMSGHGHGEEGRGGSGGDGSGHGHDKEGGKARLQLTQRGGHGHGGSGADQEQSGQGHRGSGGGEMRGHQRDGSGGGRRHDGGGNHQQRSGGGHGDSGGGREGGGHGDSGGGHQGGGRGHGGSGGGHEGGGHEGGHGGGQEEEVDRSDPPVPTVATQRAANVIPKAPGTRETIKLQYGPFELPPGTDASQVSMEFAAPEGFITAASPSIRFADGTPVTHDDMVHLHHAHLFRKDQSAETASSDTRTGYEWVFGTGDEQTAGSFERIGDADPRGRRYGVHLERGDPMLMVWMPMNMTRENRMVFLEFEFEFLHGTPDDVEKATGTRYRPLEPVLYGQTFNVPKTGGFFAWPLDARRSDGDALSDSQLDHESFMTTEPTNAGSVKPGVGHVWTAPRDGELIGAAGHMHEGGTGVVFSALGSEASPCPSDADRYPGTTVFHSSAYYPPGIFPTHLKMGTTQTGWRLRVRKGDRIAINGVYDSRTYAWPDQMSVVGMYFDPAVAVGDGERCQAQLVNEPDASQAEVVASVPKQTARRGDDGSDLFHHMNEPCVADECNDYEAAPLARGPHGATIRIEDFTFTPGNLKTGGLVGGSVGGSLGGAPVVTRGERLRFVNADYVRNGGTRHAIASCHGPCNGPDAMSYPNSNGLFYSGPIGYVPLAETASAENQGTPTWDLDTSGLAEGYHTFYCFSHRWMRGAFYVEELGG